MDPPGQLVYTPKPGGRLLLRVVVKEDAHAFRVVTAYRTSKIAKYWRSP